MCASIPSRKGYVVVGFTIPVNYGVTLHHDILFLVIKFVS